MSATSYTGDEPYVYACYPREDLHLVQPEFDRLHELGIRVCFPAPEAEPGDDGRLAGAEFVLILVSDSMEEDPDIRKEVSSALEEGKDLWAVHVVDVPLGGAAKLLLSSVSSLHKHEVSEDDYVRRLVRLLPDEVKSRPIDLGPDPSSSAPARRPEPGVKEQLESMGTAQLGVAAGAVVIVVLILIAMALTGGDEGPRPEASATPVPSESLSPEEAAEVARLQQEREERARQRREKEEREREAREKSQAAATKVANAVSAARAAFSEDEYARVIELLTPILQEQPKAAAAALLRAQAYMRNYQYAEAAPDFSVVLEAEPKNVEALRGRGEALVRTEKHKGALVDYQALVELTPKDSFAWVDLGDVQMELKDYAGASASYDKAIELQPQSPRGYDKRASARAKAGDEAGAADDRAKARELRNRR